MSQFVCINGDILPNTTSTIDVFNRSYNFGDGVVEIMRTRGNRIIFWNEHWQRLIQNMSKLGMNNQLFPSQAEITAAASRLIHRNKLLKASCLKLIVYRKGITDEDVISDEIGYTMTARPIEHGIFILPPKGVLINIYTDYPKLLGPTSSFMTTSALFNIMALKRAKEKGLNDSILINQNDHLIEATFSNLFILQEGILYTPPLSDGCVNGVIREKMIEIANENEIPIKTTHSIGPANLYLASEVMLTSAITGINWVMGYRNHRYFNRTAKRLVELLNRKAGLIDS